MTENPATADPTATVGEVLSRLFELDVRHLPIVDGSRLVGIVSDRDVRQFAAPNLEELLDGDLKQRLEEPISTYMAADLVTVNPETEVSEAIDLMLDQRIGAIPVIDPDNSQLAGIVSYVDILKAVQELV